jgi:Putative MetA-pathway of phenol degradation
MKLQYLKFLARNLSILQFLVLAAARAHAGDIEPRAYVNTPVGVNFLLMGYAYSKGGLSTNALPIEDAELTIKTEILAYARSLDVWGNSGKFDVIVPFSDLSGTAMVAGQPRERVVSGLHDPRFRFSVNFYGSPALSLQEFNNYKQDLLIGASIQLSAPFGQYDSQKLINLGNNRWFIKPDIGISKAFGAITLELSESATFFTKNDDYFGGNTLEQKPVYTSQAHLAYDFGRGIWGALDAVYDYGGRTKVNGIWSDEVQSNSRWGATLALPINKNNSIKLYASTGASTRTGSDYDLGGIVWQYRWGGGL